MIDPVLRKIREGSEQLNKRPNVKDQEKANLLHPIFEHIGLPAKVYFDQRIARVVGIFDHVALSINNAGELISNYVCIECNKPDFIDEMRTFGYSVSRTKQEPHDFIYELTQLHARYADKRCATCLGKPRIEIFTKTGANHRTAHMGAVHEYTEWMNQQEPYIVIRQHDAQPGHVFDGKNIEYSYTITVWWSYE